MDRIQAVKFAKEELARYNLETWHVRLNTSIDTYYLALCSHRDKAIILNAHYVDTVDEKEIKDTIWHEIAHALVGANHAHDEIWIEKAKALGCYNPKPCREYSLSLEAIDAIRSGANLIIEFEEEVVRRPKYRIEQLKDTCETCGKIAKELTSFEKKDKDGNTVVGKLLVCGHMRLKVVPRGTPFETMVSNSWKEDVKNCNHKWTKNKCDHCGEFKLFDFQISGARFIESSLTLNRGAGIFDEMGLGKTVQALAYLKYHPEKFPVLFVVKSGLKYQFFKEIIRWLGPEYFAQIISRGTDPIIPNLNCYIVSYDLLRRMDLAKIEELKIKHIILDECQQIKNVDSTRTHMVRRLVKMENCTNNPLSGSPWKNRGSELFPVLNMLDPVKFHSNKQYVDHWVDYYYQGAKRKEGGIRRPERFKEYCKDIFIRRERTEVMKELPLVNRLKLNIKLEEIDQQTYNEATSEFVKWYNEFVMSGEEDSIDGLQILAQLSRMRHITGLAKIPATVAYVEDFLEETDRKLVVFVHHIDVGQLLLDKLTELGKEYEIPVLALKGGMDALTRSKIQDEFNNSKRAILVASTLAAGEGLNLQTCSDCIIHERQWNPANEEQAEGRFIRIGQTSDSVNSTYCEASETIDEHLDSIIEVKRRQFHEVMNKGQAVVWNQSDMGKQLAEKIVNKFNKENKRVNISSKARMVKR